jgi:hypothetical protein
MGLPLALFSALSCAHTITVTFATQCLALGFVADRYGLRAALSLIGAGSALAFVLVMMSLIKAVKGLLSTRQQTDVSTP